MHHSYIDRFAQGDSPVHRLDARAKLAAVVAYTAVLISFDRYAVAALAPMAILPLAMLWLAGVPTWFALRRVAVASPLILALCLVSPFYDRPAHAVRLGPWAFDVAGGWLTAADVAAKFALALIALTALVSSTRFSLLLEALQRFRLPRVLVMQLGLLYRYLFVLIDEAMRIRRGRDFRGAAQAPIARRLGAVGGIVASLFVRTLDRADRVGVAMAARGFDGHARSLSRLRFRPADAAFLAATAAYLLLCRWAWPAILA